jgi:tetratricopeptide (TPR) repeat protein
MQALTFRFSRPEAVGDVYRLELEHPLAGEASGTFARPFDDPSWMAVTLALDPAFDLDDPRQFSDEQRAALKALLAPLDPLLETVGRALLDALLADEGPRSVWHTALGAAGSGSLPVELRFGAGADPLAALPWELLYGDGRFLVADNTLTLARTPLGSAPYNEALGALPLRIVLVLSEPLGASPIAPQRQARQLVHGLRALAAEGAVVVDELRPPTFDTLVEAVRTGGYHALHFYGHGVYGDGAGHLLFEDAYGGPDLVKADDVGAALRGAGIRLVVMGACQSAMSGFSQDTEPVDQWSSTAAALLRAGVPLVVGMQVSMFVVAAQAFTRQFYLSLAAGKDVFHALGDARLPLRRDAYGKSWFIPALYSRVHGEPRLFDPAAPRAVDTEAVTQLRQTQAEVERLEEEVSRLGEANTLQAIGDVHNFRKELDAALESYGQALALFRAVGDRLGEANTLQAIGDVQRFRDAYDDALESYGQALALFRAVGDRLGEANTLQAIGFFYLSQENTEEALSTLDQALDLYRQVGDRVGQANIYWDLGTHLAQNGHLQKAEPLLAQAVALAQQFAPGHPLTGQWEQVLGQVRRMLSGA